GRRAGVARRGRRLRRRVRRRARHARGRARAARDAGAQGARAHGRGVVRAGRAAAALLLPAAAGVVGHPERPERDLVPARLPRPARRAGPRPALAGEPAAGPSVDGVPAAPVGRGGRGHEPLSAVGTFAGWRLQATGRRPSGTAVARELLVLRHASTLYRLRLETVARARLDELRPLLMEVAASAEPVPQPAPRQMTAGIEPHGDHWVD